MAMLKQPPNTAGCRITENTLVRYDGEIYYCLPDADNAHIRGGQILVAMHGLGRAAMLLPLALCEIIRA